MDTPRIASVRPLEGKRLLVEFVNGARRVYDCKQLMHLKPFKVFEDEGFFQSVSVDRGGYGISWNDDIDLSEYELWTNSMETALA